jgi:hypothetical protein
MIRHLKPKRIIEVGGGYSTLMIQYALAKATAEDTSYTCDHTCIEPYEQPWLDSTGVNLIRERVETLDTERFRSLGQDDLLFIDSSHVIRPQGDVVFELLQLLGTLNKGVYVHFHDIFTPRDYPEEWVIQDSKLWNEQYLLEGFLAFNQQFTVVAALNHLFHHYYGALAEVCPTLTPDLRLEPRSFWITRN